ncbi:alpha-ketoglutarate-dependent dioxygenase alkB homolog 3-like [Exaiptasia diaphana]|uniref:Fe2OG dioxygenase domain-containing protein n=1 Tax=Exaiptasia diaphana TaxID=2652724 RepID=A0A913XU52_EXADI|nr:alpha-ketoglutarate-dependent dioxygenase alkB homolog 3-like [Exaiptasia diaphana]
MDKRRKNRIQGTWASQTRRKETQTARQTTTSQVPGNEAFQPSAHRFVFQQDVVNTVKRAPPEQVISEKGVYELSSGSFVEFVPNFLSRDEKDWMFQQLESEIPWDSKKIKIKGEYHVQPRLTAWFGDFPYTYSGLFTQTGLTFNSMLANLYRDDKDSVDWHSDDEPSLGNQPVIASLSLGDTRNFELRKKPTQGNDFSLMPHVKIPLASGSLLIMKGSTQDDWQHRVPKEYHHRDPRINLTFRNISPS